MRVPMGAADTTCRAGTTVVQGPAPPGEFLRALWVNRKVPASLQEGFEAGACQRADCAGAVVSQAEVGVLPQVGRVVQNPHCCCARRGW